MSMIATAVKVAALAATLTCVGSLRPMPDGTSLPKRDPASLPLKCRHYFGCAPIASTATAVAERQTSTVAERQTSAVAERQTSAVAERQTSAVAE